MYINLETQGDAIKGILRAPLNNYRKCVPYDDFFSLVEYNKMFIVWHSTSDILNT